MKSPLDSTKKFFLKEHIKVYQHASYLVLTQHK